MLKIRRHAQNLGREIAGVCLDPLWRYGRGWWTLVYDRPDDPSGKSFPSQDLLTLSANWHLGRDCNRTHAGLVFLTEGDNVLVHVGVQGVFSFYFGASFLSWDTIKALGLDDVAATGFGFDAFGFSVANFPRLDTFVSLAVWSQEHHDSAKEKRRWHWFPVERLTGGMVYTPASDDKVLNERLVTICLPEGDYDLRVRIMHGRRVWKRLPLPAENHVYAQVDVVSGDGIIDGAKGRRGVSCQATTVHDAVGEFMASVCKDRGGDFHWGQRRGQGLRAMAGAVANDGV